MMRETEHVAVSICVSRSDDGIVRPHIVVLVVFEEHDELNS